MRSAILEEVGNLVIKDVPKPSPGHEEALIKISSAGVCHSDLHIIKGDWPLAGILDPPIPTGHEGIGVIEELGPGAENFLQIGDRVILGLGGAGGGYWCGACEECLAGRPMFCARLVWKNAYRFSLREGAAVGLPLNTPCCLVPLSPVALAIQL